MPIFIIDYKECFREWKNDEDADRHPRLRSFRMTVIMTVLSMSAVPAMRQGESMKHSVIFINMTGRTIIEVSFTNNVTECQFGEIKW